MNTYQFAGATRAKQRKRPRSRYLREVYMRPINRERLKKRREEAGFTQRELAMLCKCTQAAISALETGAMPNCSADLAKQIARRLDRDLEELFHSHDGARVHRVTNAVKSNHQNDRLAA